MGGGLLEIVNFEIVLECWAHTSMCRYDNGSIIQSK